MENQHPQIKSLKVWAMPGKYPIGKSRLEKDQKEKWYVFKAPGGRPPVFLTKEQLRLLRAAYLVDASDEEACGYAGITTYLLRKHQNANPEFIKEKQAWKNTPILKARKSVVGALEKDPDLALKYLERKRKDEFSTKTVSDVALRGQEYFEKMRKDLGIDEESLEAEAKQGN